MAWGVCWNSRKVVAVSDPSKYKQRIALLCQALAMSFTEGYMRLAATLPTIEDKDEMWDIIEYLETYKKLYDATMEAYFPNGPTSLNLSSNPEGFND